jgi:hypothetical protein
MRMSLRRGLRRRMSRMDNSLDWILDVVHLSPRSNQMGKRPAEREKSMETKAYHRTEDEWNAKDGYEDEFETRAEKENEQNGQQS